MGTVGKMMDNKFKVQTSTSKVIASVLWENEGILLVKFLKRGAMFSSEQYVPTLKKFIART
jgi:mRNA-degrading endonuclease RelE of RelBE toxin-antitoxin system